MQRRIYEMIELQQNREKVEEKAQLYRLKIKSRFDRKIKDNTFSVGDMVLRCDIVNLSIHARSSTLRYVMCPQ